MDTMRDRFVAVTTEMLDADPRVAVVLADIGVGPFTDLGVTTRHPDRIVNVGIREQAMIGVAAGMALAGLRPVVHSYTPFLVERPFEQLKLDLSHQDLGAVLVSIGASHDASSEGRTHQAPGDVAAVSSLPGWEIHVPGHPDEAEVALRGAIAGERRVYVRLSGEANRSAYPGAVGGIEVLRAGSRRAPTVLAIGPMLDTVLAATEGMNVTIAYTATPHPLDARTLRAITTGTDVVVVEPYLQGTSAASITAALHDRPIRLTSVGVPNQEFRHYGTPAEHRTAQGLNVAGLRTALGAPCDACLERWVS